MSFGVRIMKAGLRFPIQTNFLLRSFGYRILFDQPRVDIAFLTCQEVRIMLEPIPFLYTDVFILSLAINTHFFFKFFG